MKFFVGKSLNLVSTKSATAYWMVTAVSAYLFPDAKNPYWILSFAYHPWHVLGSQQTKYNSVAEGILMMRLTNLLVESKMCTGVGDDSACLWDCTLWCSHVATWLTMTLSKLSLKPPTSPHTHPQTRIFSSPFLQPLAHSKSWNRLLPCVLVLTLIAATSR